MTAGTITLMTLPHGVGFVGLSASGWASTALAPAIFGPALSSTYRLVAVSTSSEASAARSAAKHSTETNAVHAYSGETTAIARDPQVDLVAVSVKAPYHHPALLPVIAAKKKFFVEWPAGKNLTETKELARLAKEQGLKNMVGFQGRFSPTIIKMRQIVHSGTIGKVLSTSIIALAPREMGFWGPSIKEGSEYILDKDQGVTMLDIGVGHQLDALTHILGDFANVSATTAIAYSTSTTISSARKTAVTADDHVALSGILKSGAVASVIWRGGYPSTPGRLQFVWIIDGEEGSLRVESESVGGAFLNVQDPKLLLNGQEVQLESGGLGEYVTAAWSNFAESDTAVERTYATMEDAVRIKTLLVAIDKSARDGVRVEF